MAERRPPGFNVDLGFYDSAEVLSIPRRIRAAAVGVWTLSGAYAANKLSDGHVPAEALRDRGCTPAIRDALMATTPEPLWEDAGAGSIRFTRWSKWQRTAAEIKAYREGEAERKRKAREAKKAARDAYVASTRGSRDDHVDATWSPDEAYVADDINGTYGSDDSSKPQSASGNPKASGRTSAGHPPGVRAEDGDPKTETETETETKRKEQLASQAPPKPKAERGHHLPDDWKPSAETTAWAQEKYPHLQLRSEFEKFSNHWHAASGQNARKRNWDMAFKNWLMNAKPAAGTNGHRIPASDAAFAQAQALKGNPTNVLEIEP